jgi:hypothetical protein
MLTFEGNRLLRLESCGCVEQGGGFAVLNALHGEQEGVLRFGELVERVQELLRAVLRFPEISSLSCLS